MLDVANITVGDREQLQDQKASYDEPDHPLTNLQIWEIASSCTTLQRSAEIALGLECM